MREEYHVVRREILVQSANHMKYCNGLYECLSKFALVTKARTSTFEGFFSILVRLKASRHSIFLSFLILIAVENETLNKIDTAVHH
jgi:hypothetical protein